MDKLSLNKLFSFETFRIGILFFILAGELSFLGYFLPPINVFAFFLIIILTIILGLKKLDYAVYILLAELFIGSKGYLFHLDIAGMSISIRLALFLVIAGIWLLRVLQRRAPLNFFKSKICIFYLLFFIFLIWGLINGLINGHSFDNLFFDFNNWLFFALIFILFDVITSWTILKHIISIFGAAVIILFFETSFLFWLFSRAGIWRYLTFDFYRWLRLVQIAEITKFSENIYRIFIQSQLYYLFGFFLILGLIFYIISQNKLKLVKKKLTISLILLFLCSFPLFISFSRSFWLGLSGALIAFILIFKIKNYLSWKNLSILTSCLLLVVLLVFSFISLLIYPNKVDNLVEKRLSVGGPATINRFQELGPLLKGITEKPIFGAGFGKTITYQTTDPRTIERVGGRYTTYAFEWGYLDIWLKIGIAGLFVYLLLIWKIWRRGWCLLTSQIQDPRSKGAPAPTRRRGERLAPTDIGAAASSILIMGLLFGLLAIIITHFTSPYLNHPLGIGYLILVGVVFELLSTKGGLASGGPKQKLEDSKISI